MDQTPGLARHGAKEEEKKFVKQSFTDRTWCNGFQSRNLSSLKRTKGSQNHIKMKEFHPKPSIQLEEEKREFPIFPE